MVAQSAVFRLFLSLVVLHPLGHVRVDWAVQNKQCFLAHAQCRPSSTLKEGGGGKAKPRKAALNKTLIIFHTASEQQIR